MRTRHIMAFLCLVAAVRPIFPATLELPSRSGAPSGDTAVVAIRTDDAEGFLGTDMTIVYDPNVALALSASVTGVSAGHLLVSNLVTPGQLRLALYGPDPLAGSGALIEILFESVGPDGSSTDLTFQLAQVNEGAIATTTLDGAYCVEGLPFEATDLEVDILPSTTVATFTWTGPPEADAFNLYRGTEPDLSDSSCFLQEIGTASAQDDGAVPPPGGMFIYLVTALACSGESTAGFASNGTPRILPQVCEP